MYKMDLSDSQFMFVMETSAPRTTQNYKSFNKILSKQQVVCTHELGHDLRCRQSENVQIPLMIIFWKDSPFTAEVHQTPSKGSFNDWIYTAIWNLAAGHRNGPLPRQLVCVCVFQVCSKLQE